MDKHQVCVHFKNDNNLSMTVEYLPTGEYFINENIELIRIKKDTVIATLERKSEKHLLCITLSQFRSILAFLAPGRQDSSCQFHCKLRLSARIQGSYRIGVSGESQ